MEQWCAAFQEITALENLWRAWVLFRRGKRHRADVRAFERNLERNLLEIRNALVVGTYRHGAYRSFVVHDPKRRMIHAPGIRDQVVHQMIWNVVFPFFDRRFASTVMSCRPGRGTHAAVSRMQRIAKRLGTRERVSMLHLDIVKFFDSVPHDLLRAQLQRWIACEQTLRVLDEVIGSYDSGCRLPGDALGMRRGIPLGNLTSQLFANVVLMPFDRMVEAAGWGPAHVRYADDVFVVWTDAEALRVLGERYEGVLREFGFSCRWRIRRSYGFEALGKRLFFDGCGIRRSTRRRALAKLCVRSWEYGKSERSGHALEASAASVRGLAAPGYDVRWSRAIASTVLDYACTP